MPSATRHFDHNSALCALLLLLQPIAATGFVPRDVTASETISRRICEPAAPDNSESLIIADICNQTVANDFPTCSDQMTAHMQESAASTCGQYSNLLTDCLMANNNDHTVCADSLFGYQDCEVYTMQAYAYCGCYYTLPASIVDCANEQLQPQPPGTSTVPATTINPDLTSLTASPATKVPSPPPLAVSEEAAPSSHQSTHASSDPGNSNNPSEHLYTDLPPNAPPSTSTARTPIVITYTTTSTETIIPAAISTVYTRAEHASNATFPACTPIVPAAYSSGARTPEASADQDNNPDPPASPSISTFPTQITKVGASVPTSGRNMSAVCIRFRKRRMSKVF